jgi:hypothetical protein
MQQLHGATKHICDNDISGLRLPRSPINEMTVQRIRRIFLMQRIPKAINKKRLVRYKEGAEMYSMGMNKFQSLAKDAGAILKIDRMVLVDLDTFDQYLESFRVK